jgi:hypothetical protein
MKAGAQRIGGDGFAHQVGRRLQLPEGPISAGHEIHDIVVVRRQRVGQLVLDQRAPPLGSLLIA